MSTNDTRLYIATYIDIKRDALVEGIALLVLYRESRTTAGGSNIDVLRETSRPNRFAIIESCKDQSAFDDRERAEQTLQFRAKLRAIHSSPYDQRVHHGFAIGASTGAIPRESFCVVTHVDVPPPRKDETEVLLKRLAEQSRNDEGNIRYDVFQQIPPRTNHFTMFAAWKDAEAFESHESKAHRQDVRETLWPLLGAPYDERLYRPLRGNVRFVVDPLRGAAG
jgi:quinol monooxygenase YgiN